MPGAPDFRIKLRNLTGLRCLMVTLLLGSALAVNINNLQTLDHPSYRGLTALIVITYLFTVAIGLGLRYAVNLQLLTHISFLYDGLCAAGLVLLTGQFDSPFTYLFVIVPMYGGVIADRRSGLAAAAYTTVAIGLVLLFQREVFTASWVLSADLDTPAPYFQAVTLTLAAWGAGWLSGVLAERLAVATDDLVVSHRNLAVLRDLNERIVTGLSSGLITLDHRGCVTYGNPASYELLAATPAKLLGATLEELGIAAPPSQARARWESDLVHPDGSVSALGFSSVPLLDVDGASRGTIVSFQDLTLLRQAERVLRHRDRLATVGRFASSIAHEIRNPLASISGSVEMLADLSAVTDEDRALLRIIQREIDRLNQLISGLLRYAAQRELVRRHVRIDHLLAELATLFRGHPAAAQVTLDLVAPPLHGLADPEALHQIVLNLWLNAAEATGPGGRVRTVVSETSTDLVLRVSDDGPGVPASAVESIFEPFFTTKASGTGLGLATAFQLAVGHGGTLRLLDPGNTDDDLPGACFELRLPTVVEIGSGELSGDAGEVGTLAGQELSETEAARGRNYP